MFNTLSHLPDIEFLAREPLAKYTAARLGGEADVMVIAKSITALTFTVRWAKRHNVPWLILGGGTNVLISDQGFRGLVILNQAKDVSINAETGLISAESGANLSTLARRCMGKGLMGLEWCVSVPGTVGGAVVNNAGAHGSDMAQSLSEIKVLDLQDPDNPQIWFADKLNYDYRYSILKGRHDRYIVLEAYMQLETGHDPTELQEIADTFVSHRKRTQPPGASLGSIFKNPYGDYAGRLIEEAGLKGHRIGGISVSERHANFFINDGNGTASDYYALITHVQAVIREKMGVDLEIEIEALGAGFGEEVRK